MSAATSVRYALTRDVKAQRIHFTAVFSFRSPKQSCLRRTAWSSERT